MKKILTLVLLTFVSLASFAQSEFGGVILKQETQLTARANVDELILKASVQYKGTESVALQSVKLNLEGTTPIIFSVLTTNTMQQAVDRSGGIHGNKGTEGAITAIKMIECTTQSM